MSRKNGRGTMIGKPCWAVLAAIVLALAFFTGCSSTPATVTPGAVTTIAAISPTQQNTVVGTAFTSPLYAKVVTVAPGGAQTPVVGATVTFSSPGAGAGGNFSGATSATATTDSNGIATSPQFTANGTVGTYNVIASAATTTSTALFNMANNLQPAPISVSGGSPQSTTAGTQFASPLAVTVLDGSGNPVGAQLPVTFKAPDGSFTDSDSATTIALTNASGVATSAPYVASSVIGGQYTVTASTVDGDTLTANFTLSNTIQPATITANTGTTPQTAAVNTPFAVPLSVTVMDGSTPPVPVPNAVVTFTAPAYTVDSTTLVTSAASGSFDPINIVVTTTAWTDSSGVATAAPFTANALPGGPYNVTATVGGATVSVNFALTNQ